MSSYTLIVWYNEPTIDEAIESTAQAYVKTGVDSESNTVLYWLLVTSFLKVDNKSLNTQKKHANIQSTVAKIDSKHSRSAYTKHFRNVGLQRLLVPYTHCRT